LTTWTREWAGDVLVEDARAALIENGTFGSLKDDVVSRVALLQFALDFAGEVVFLVLGFPVAVGQVVEVDEGTVHDYGRPGALDAILGDERELRLGLSSTLCQQILKATTNRAFMIDI